MFQRFATRSCAFGAVKNNVIFKGKFDSVRKPDRFYDYGKYFKKFVLQVSNQENNRVNNGGPEQGDHFTHQEGMLFFPKVGELKKLEHMYKRQLYLYMGQEV